MKKINLAAIASALSTALLVVNVLRFFEKKG
jgi:hypothetical protein